jgi:hypothetical protein
MDQIANIDKIDKLLDKQLSAFGKDKALTILLNQSTNYKKSFLNDEVIKVIKIVCSEFSYTYDELVHSNDKTWQRVWALKFCCYYLINVKGVRSWIVSYVLNRSKSLTYRYAREVKDTNDKIVIKLRNSFDKKIK